MNFTKLRQRLCGASTHHHPPPSAQALRYAHPGSLFYDLSHQFTLFSRQPLSLPFRRSQLSFNRKEQGERGINGAYVCAFQQEPLLFCCCHKFQLPTYYACFTAVLFSHINVCGYEFRLWNGRDEFLLVVQMIFPVTLLRDGVTRVVPQNMLH